MLLASILQSSGLPILSEEGKTIPFEERRNWEYFWMVDPLDGTKEFLKRNGEFTVNIALINKNKPVMGVVAVPVTEDVFYTSDDGAFLKRKGVTQKLDASRKNKLTTSRTSGCCLPFPHDRGNTAVCQRTCTAFPCFFRQQFEVYDVSRRCSRRLPAICAHDGMGYRRLARHR